MDGRDARAQTLERGSIQGAYGRVRWRQRLSRTCAAHCCSRAFLHFTHTEGQEQDDCNVSVGDRTKVSPASMGFYPMGSIKLSWCLADPYDHFRSAIHGYTIACSGIEIRATDMLSMSTELQLLRTLSNIFHRCVILPDYVAAAISSPCSVRRRVYLIIYCSPCRYMAGGLGNTL